MRVVLSAGYDSVKINGHDVYAVYDPARVTILYFKDVGTGLIAAFSSSGPSCAPATHAVAGDPRPPYPGAGDRGHVDALEQHASTQLLFAGQERERQRQERERVKRLQADLAERARQRHRGWGAVVELLAVGGCLAVVAALLRLPRRQG
ncbi:unnamed protein product [Prorocentrum cordatum]|uniref:Uncharacterized protein n=1 Tax=Prorocentrum cordatum TaxID=2364126 RepID=A0ABN9W4T1_9DINO|nr:unnamed protein product [Polarella glacialis]